MLHLFKSSIKARRRVIVPVAKAAQFEISDFVYHQKGHYASAHNQGGGTVAAGVLKPNPDRYGQPEEPVPAWSSIIDKNEITNSMAASKTHTDPGKGPFEILQKPKGIRIR